jgi:hypothetical protein
MNRSQFSISIGTFRKLAATTRPIPVIVTQMHHSTYYNSGMLCKKQGVQGHFITFELGSK